MSENEIKPVAWTINESLEKVAAGQIGFIAPREKITPAADVPLYDQSAIDRLTAERDDALAAVDANWVSHQRVVKAESERGAAVADAERYRWLRNPSQDVGLVLDKVVGETPMDEQGYGGYKHYEYRAGEELDAAIDAARSEGGV